MSGSQTENKKSFEHTFHSAHVVAGITKNPTFKEVGDLLNHSAAWAHRLKGAAAFAKYALKLGKGGDALYNAAKKIDDTLGKGVTVVADFRHFVIVGEALSVLNKYKGYIPDHPMEVAGAADKLFKEAAAGVGKLPGPSVYLEQGLTELSKLNIFTVDAKGGHPEQDRESQAAKELDDYYNQK